MANIGRLETLRWRAGDKQKDESSFQKIVAILKEHAVPKTPPTKIGQNPRVKKEAYHNLFRLYAVHGVAITNFR